MTINTEQDAKKRRIEHYLNWALNYAAGTTQERAILLRQRATEYRALNDRVEASAMKQAAQILERRKD